MLCRRDDFTCEEGTKSCGVDKFIELVENVGVLMLEVHVWV